MAAWDFIYKCRILSSEAGTGTGVPEFVEHHATVTEWRLDGSNSV